jgi:hypothetical protein
MKMNGCEKMKKFNTSGDCDPNIHYMVNIDGNLQIIKRLVDDGNYFVINRPRQYGKTTTLINLQKTLSPDYDVIFMSLADLSEAFEKEHRFCLAIIRKIFEWVEEANIRISKKALSLLKSDFRMARKKPEREFLGISDLSIAMRLLCKEHKKPLVLTIDEIDKAYDSDIFLTFLGSLRDSYLYFKNSRFKSVILAGVRDIRNLKPRIRPDSASVGEKNSPWNIAVKFDLDMAFSPQRISSMLKEYSDDHGLDLDVGYFGNLIHEYTSGYPYLASRLCQIIDKEVVLKYGFPDLKSAWTEQGFLCAEKILRTEENTLMQSLKHKLESFPSLRDYVRKLLFSGGDFSFSKNDIGIEEAALYGFIKDDGNGNSVISNRIFQTYLYDYFTHEYSREYSDFYSLLGKEKDLVLAGGILNVETLLLKFKNYYEQELRKHEIYSEDVGRYIFITYIRLLLNGAGYYFIEPQTKDKTRLDIVIVSSFSKIKRRTVWSKFPPLKAFIAAIEPVDILVANQTPPLKQIFHKYS